MVAAMRIAEAPSAPAREARTADPRRWATVPFPLAALLALSVCLGATWAILVPAFNAPDETLHFAYAQVLAERFDLPGDPELPAFSTEQSRGADVLNADQTAGQPGVKPEWSADLEARWRAEDARLAADDGGGPTAAALNPPMAYLWNALGYRAAQPGTLFDHLLGARAGTLIWLPVTVLAVWLLAGEVFGRRRLAQLAAAAVPALLPMLTFVSSSVTPDGMLYATWSLALWLGTRALRRSPSVGNLAALAGVVGLACTVKATSYALVPGVLVVLAVSAWRTRRHQARRLGALAAAVALPLALTIGVWFAIASGLERRAAAQLVDATAGTTNYREFASYLWQFYLPRPPFLTDYRFTTEGLPLMEVWIKHTWAAFGWLEVRFSDGVYRALAVLSGVLVLLAAARLWLARRRIDWAVVGFLAAVVAALLIGLHWTDYRQTEAGSKGFMQGRYLFPLIGIAGLAVAGALDLVPRRLRGSATGITIGALATFHVLCLGLVLDRFYA